MGGARGVKGGALVVRGDGIVGDAFVETGKLQFQLALELWRGGEWGRGGRGRRGGGEELRVRGKNGGRRVKGGIPLPPSP